MFDIQPQVVKAYKISETGSLVVVIPKPIRDQTGVSQETHFQVKIVEGGCLVYKPIDLESEGGAE